MNMQPHNDSDQVSSELQILQEKVSLLEGELERSKNDHRRALADYVNLQRNTQEERRKIISSATAELITQLLEPLDHLQTAAAHFSDKSLEMIRSQIMKVLEQEGLSLIKAEGQSFDPHTMEAVGVVRGKKDVVITVRQEGYQLGGVLLRPARVEVGNGE